MDVVFFDQNYENPDQDESFVSDFLRAEKSQKFTPYNEEKVLQSINTNTNIDFSRRKFLNSPDSTKSAQLTPDNESINDSPKQYHTELTRKDFAIKALQKLELCTSDKMKIKWEINKSSIESISGNSKSLKKTLLSAFKDSLEEKLMLLNKASKEIKDTLSYKNNSMIPGNSDNLLVSCIGGQEKMKELLLKDIIKQYAKLNGMFQNYKKQSRINTADLNQMSMNTIMQERLKLKQSEKLETRALELSDQVSDLKRFANIPKSLRNNSEYFYKSQSNTKSNEISNGSSISNTFGKNVSFESQNTPSKITSLFEATKRGFVNLFSSNHDDSSNKKDKGLVVDIKKGFSCLTCAPMRVDMRKTPQKLPINRRNLTNSKADDLEKLASDLKNEIKSKKSQIQEDKINTLQKLELPISCESIKKKDRNQTINSNNDCSMFELSYTDEKIRRQFFDTFNSDKQENLSQIDFSKMIAETTKNSDESRISPRRKLIFTNSGFDNLKINTNSLNKNLFSKEKNCIKSKGVENKENMILDRNDIVRKSKSSAWLDIF